MPLYHYKCKSCEFSFEVWHSMSFEDQTCTKCKSKEVFRVPEMGDTSNNIPFSTSQTGKVVDEYIRDVKSEIKKEKKDLKTREL